MRKLFIACLLTVAGCAGESPPAEPEGIPQAAIVSPVAKTPRAVNDKPAMPAKAKTKITVADALRIHREQLGDNQEPEREPVARLLEFRDGYRRAWKNVHGDPGLQGPTVFGKMEDLNREGHCWSVEAKYGGQRHVVGYIDEFGDLLYAFQP